MRKLTALLIALLLLVSLATGQTKTAGTAKIGGTTGLGATGGGGGGSSLDTGLVGFWKLGEAAGNTRADSGPNGHTLSESAATVGSTTGKIGDAASFVQTNFLRIADNASLSITTDLTIVSWVRKNVSQTEDFPAFASKWGAGDQRSFNQRYDAIINRFTFSASSDGTSGTVVTATANTFGAISSGTFYFVVSYVDLAGDVIGISVNNGAVDTAAYTASGVFDSTADFEIGHLETANHTWFGEIDAVGIWSRKLTATEITCLYNSGTGQETPFAACP